MTSLTPINSLSSPLVNARHREGVDSQAMIEATTVKGGLHEW